MRGLTSVAAAAVLTLGLAGCGGGAGAHCGDFKNADKTIVAVQDGIAAGIASGRSGSARQGSPSPGSSPALP